MSFNITPVGSGYQEIHPYSVMNIDSVKINTSLIMMKECPIIYVAQNSTTMWHWGCWSGQNERLILAIQPPNFAVFSSDVWRSLDHQHTVILYFQHCLERQIMCKWFVFAQIPFLSYCLIISPTIIITHVSKYDRPHWTWGESLLAQK